MTTRQTGRTGIEGIQDQLTEDKLTLKSTENRLKEIKSRTPNANTEQIEKTIKDLKTRISLAESAIKDSSK